MATRNRFTLPALAMLLIAAPAITTPLRAELPQQQRPDFALFGANQGLRTIPAEIRDDQRVTLVGNVHAALRDAQEIGITDPALPMQKMILTFKMAPDAKYRLDQLLAAQQDPKSSYFHQWLTPSQFGHLFGPSQADLNAVTAWLLSKGFEVRGIANGRMSLEFSGSVAQVQNAFRTSIRDYKIGNEIRHANAEDPSIPAAFANVVAGIVSLHNIPRRNYNTGLHPLSAADAAAVTAKHGTHTEWSGSANNTSGVFLAPSDWATIYNANGTYSSNGQGSGATIGIVGRTNPGTANWATFRSQVGLPANTPTITVNGTDPGDLGSGEDGEADLDAEWSGGTAPLATVKFVASASTSSTDGVDLSAQYIVDNNLADVMSTSFGQCESSMGSTENTFYNNLWSQAASQGITACISTGDSGPAGCNGGSDASGSGGYGVNGLASTPYDVAVGASQLSTSSSYWDANGNATGYIPEQPWNESGTVSGGSGLWSTSSGASSTYTKPSWQVAPGVPSASHRYLPDVSLDGSDMFFSNYGMLVYSQGAMATTGGTSAASPSFAGVMALVVAKYGRQGNANTKLYTLGNAQYASGGPAVFHDLTTGNNNVPGLTGFSAATGWDEATGLGTPNVTNLVNDWNGGGSTPNTVTASISTPSGNVTVASGASQSFVGSATDSSSSATLTYAWTFGDGGTASTASASHAYTNTGSTAVTYTATFKATDNTGVSSTATRTITVNPAPVNPNTVTASITTPSSNVTLASGASQAFAGSATDSSSSATLTYGWNFGDGSTATGASASHVFTNTGASAITRTVTFTATDNTGVSNSATRTVTVNPASTGGSEQVKNGGFESGSASWTQTSGVIGQNGPSEPAHGGTYDAWLDGYGSTHTDYVYQTITVPAAGATLTFYLHVDTDETTTTTAYDKFTVLVQNTSGTTLKTLATFSNLNAGSGYTLHSYDLSAYKGQTIRLKFNGSEDSSLQTSFVLDDVSVK